MTRYRFSDGHSLFASTAEEFVTQMRRTSFTPGEDDQDFMDLCSERGAKLGLEIRSENATVFLADLMTVGIVAPETPIEWN